MEDGIGIGFWADCCQGLEVGEETCNVSRRIGAVNVGKRRSIGDWHVPFWVSRLSGAIAKMPVLCLLDQLQLLE